MNRKKCRTPHPSDFTTDDTSQLDDDRRHRPPTADHGSLSGEEILARLLERVVAAIELLSAALVPVHSEESPQQMSHSPKEWLTPTEASSVINRSPYWVRRLCRNKTFGRKDSGGKWTIHLKELEAYRAGRITIHGETL